METNKFDQKKEEIKIAGIKSFSTYGYYKTTLEDIAGMMGMKKNSLYYYFESKEALFKELIEDEISMHIKIINKVLNLKTSPDKKLEKLIDGLIEFVKDKTFKYTVKLSAYIEIHRVVANEYKEFQEKGSLAIEKILKEGIESGVFKKHNTKQLAEDLEYVVPAMFRSYYLDSGAEFAHEVDFVKLSKMIKRMLGYVLEGIKK